MRYPLLALAIALSGTATAQQVLFESFTDHKVWTHTGTSPAWKDGVADTNALFGKVDQLVTSNELKYTRTAVTLEAGTYVAWARFAKQQSGLNAQDITLRVSGPVNATLVTPIADQAPPDTYIFTKALVFTLNAKLPVVFSLENTDKTKTKQNYAFDAFHLGRSPFGKVVHIESMGRRWGHAWGCPHYSKEIADKESPFGFVERLNQRWSSSCGSGSANLWWFDWNSKPFTLLPGTYTANLRLKKIVSISGQADFGYILKKSTDGGNTWTKDQTMTWKAVTQVVGRYVNSPNMTIKVTSPLHQWKLQLTHTCCFAKENFHIDSMAVRRGTYSDIGAGCNNAPILTGDIPQTGEPFEVMLSGVPAAQIGVLFFGFSTAKIDLGGLGLTGCTLYTLPGLTFPLVPSNNNNWVSLTLPIPNDPNLINGKFYNQALSLQTKAPVKFMSATNAAEGVIGN